MSFKFNVEKTGEIKSAHIYFVEGVCEEGDVKNGDKAKVKVGSKTVSLSILSMSFINRNRMDEVAKKITLAIEKPKCELKELEGKMLISR